MGCSCLGSKKTIIISSQSIISKTEKPIADQETFQEHDYFEGVELKEANLGIYFMEYEFNDYFKKEKISVNDENRILWRGICKTGIENYCPKEIIENRNSRNYGHKIRIDNFLLEADSEIGFNNFYIKNSEKFLELRNSFIPFQFRWIYWKTCLSFFTDFKKNEYQNILAQRAEQEHISNIQKDIERTFPDHPFFKEEKYKDKSNKSLANILKAYSIQNRELGYCQGMNFIAGFILINSGFREEESFWVFSCLMDNKIPSDKLDIKGFQGLFHNYFPLLKIMNSLFQNQLSIRNSRLKLHLDEIQLSEPMWISKWFLSLFIYNFPFYSCLRIWDHILTSGFSFLLSLILVILDFLEERLIKSDLDQANELLMNISTSVPSENLELILEKARNINLNWTELENQRKQIEFQVQKEMENKGKSARVLMPSDIEINIQKEENKEKIDDFDCISINKSDALLRCSNFLFDRKNTGSERSRPQTQQSKFLNCFEENYLQPIKNLKSKFNIKNDVVDDLSGKSISNSKKSQCFYESSPLNIFTKSLNVEKENLKFSGLIKGDIRDFVEKIKIQELLDSEIEKPKPVKKGNKKTVKDNKNKNKKEKEKEKEIENEIEWLSKSFEKVLTLEYEKVDQRIINDFLTPKLMRTKLFEISQTILIKDKPYNI